MANDNSPFTQTPKQNISTDQIAAEGAKEFVEARKMALNASYSDDYRSRDSENEAANKLEDAAYKKLASVDAAKAKALIDSEREKIFGDDQLKNSINLDDGKHAKFSKAALIAEDEATASKIAANPEAYAKAMNERIEDKAALAKHENESGRGAELDAMIKDQNTKALGKEGVPMSTMQGSIISIENDGKYLEARITSPDKSYFSFNGVNPPEDFAKDYKLSDFEKKTLMEFVDLTDRENKKIAEANKAPVIPETPRSEEQKAMDAEISKGLDLATKDVDLRTLGRVGVTMETMPDKTMHYNENGGMRGAQIDNGDGSVTEFGGKPAIEKYAKEFKLNDFELKTLIEFEDLAKRETERANIKFTDPEILMAAQDTRDAELKESLTLDQATKDRLAEGRARDTAEAQKTLNSNIIERAVAHEAVATDNKVESDEMFIARKADVKPIIPPEVEQQYLKVGDKYHYAKSPDAVAFEDKGNKLETKSNSSNVAESMVRIAAARGWDEIKVSGSETFRKEAWLEAASRGMAVKGYTPNEQDKNELAQRGKDLEANKIEKDNQPFRVRENEKEKEAEKQADKDANKELAKTFKDKTPAEVIKLHPELAGAVAAVAVMEKRAEADGLNAQQRAIVSARLRENVANSIERGNIPEVKMREEIEVKRDIKVEREAQR